MLTSYLVYFNFMQFPLVVNTFAQLIQDIRPKVKGMRASLWLVKMWILFMQVI